MYFFLRERSSYVDNGHARTRARLSRNTSQCWEASAHSVQAHPTHTRHPQHALPRHALPRHLVLSLLPSSLPSPVFLPSLLPPPLSFLSSCLPGKAGPASRSARDVRWRSSPPLLRDRPVVADHPFRRDKCSDDLGNAIRAPACGANFLPPLNNRGHQPRQYTPSGLGRPRMDAKLEGAKDQHVNVRPEHDSASSLLVEEGQIVAPEHNKKSSSPKNVSAKLNSSFPLGKELLKPTRTTKRTNKKTPKNQHTNKEKTRNNNMPTGETKKKKASSKKHHTRTQDQTKPSTNQMIPPQPHTETFCGRYVWACGN